MKARGLAEAEFARQHQLSSVDGPWRQYSKHHCRVVAVHSNAITATGNIHRVEGSNIGLPCRNARHVI